MTAFAQEPDWDRLRADFPALNRYCYFYSASGGPMPAPVHDQAIQYYRRLRDHGDALWEENLAERERVRCRVAELINADPEEIEFIPSLSYGMNVIASLLAGRGQAIASTLEFPSTTLPWLHQREDAVRVLQPAPDGTVEPERFAQAVTANTATFLTSHVQFSNGFRQDLAALGRLKGDHHLIVNASQSLGAFEVDVREMRIDALASNSYKWLLAGYGCGILYMSKALLREVGSPFVGWFGVQDRDELRNDRYELQSSAGRFNPGSPSFPTIFSLGAALDYLMEISLHKIEQRVLDLNTYLTNRLHNEGYCVLSPIGTRKHRSAQTLVKLAQPGATVRELEKRRILCTLKPEGMRVATHFFNSTEDIDHLVDSLRELAPARP